LVSSFTRSSSRSSNCFRSEALIGKIFSC
jgi:hypothetical protein